MIELKPCPFCGGKPIIDSHETSEIRPNAVRLICTVCGIQTKWYKADVDYCALEELKKDWNKRWSKKHESKYIGVDNG